MEKFMKTNGLRQAQVAIASKGVIMAERAYAWAEDDCETVATNDTFLLASVSKMFTAAAIDHLIKRGKLSLRTKVYKRIGHSDAKDERAMSITAKHLLEHKGGYDRREAGEDISVDFNKEHFSRLGSVAAVYGGYGAIMEECSAAFSLKASASTIAKFAGFHAVSGIGLRKNGSRRGDFEGARTHVESNVDFDFAVVLNT